MNRRVLFTLLFAVFSALTGIGVVAPIIPVYATSLGASGVMLGLMIAGFSITRGALQPFVGGLSDRYGRKLFLVVGLVVYSLVGLGYVVAFSVGQLILIRILNGVGSAMVVPVAMAIIGDLAPKHQEGRYMGMINIAVFAGIGGGPIIGGLFVDSLGRNSAFFAMSGFSMIAMLCVLLLLPKAERVERSATEPSLLQTLKHVVAERRFVGVLIARMATMTVMIPTLGFLPLLMNELIESSGLQVGIVIASRTLLSSVLQTPFGRLADRYSKWTLLGIGSLIIAGAMFAVPFMRSFPALIAVFAVLGTGEAIAWPTLGAYAVESGQRHGQGAVMGVFNMAISIGMLIGSLAAGTFMDALGIRFVFFAISAIVVVCTVAALALIGPASTASLAEPRGTVSKG